MRIQGYNVVFEEGPASWGAYVPDLPVCAAVADTREEVERSIDKAITMHLEGLREDEQERAIARGNVVGKTEQKSTA
jgi:predicted RNase H-like HicB family nuclease